MEVRLESQFPLTDESIRAGTGRTWQEWFDYLDARGGPEQGRRAINNHLYADLKLDMWWCSTINMRYEAANGIVERDGRSKGYNVCSTKTIAAPLEKAYAAWMDPASLNQWFGAGCRANVTDGGEFSNSDGNRGVYKRVRANKDLRFTWEGPSEASGSLVDVTFEDKGKGKTAILVTHDRIQTREEADGLREGWGQALDRLKRWLEA